MSDKHDSERVARSRSPRRKACALGERSIGCGYRPRCPDAQRSLMPSLGRRWSEADAIDLFHLCLSVTVSVTEAVTWSVTEAFRRFMAFHGVSSLLSGPKTAVLASPCLYGRRILRRSLPESRTPATCRAGLLRCRGSGAKAVPVSQRATLPRLPVAAAALRYAGPTEIVDSGHEKLTGLVVTKS